jgi:hypothetical protein
MWRFLNRSRQANKADFSPRHTDNSDEVSDEESQASDKFHCTSVKTDTEKKICLYNKSYLSVGFTWTADASCPVLCASSMAMISNAAMASAKLKQNLTINHSHMTSKSADYFKRLLESKNKKRKHFVSKVTGSEKAQEASYLVAELIAQRR